MERGQVTVEYIVILSLMSIVFLIIMNSVMEGKRSQSQSLWSQDGKRIAKKVADSVNMAHIAGDGSRHNVTLPAKLVGGVAYNITIRPRLVTVDVPLYGRDFEWKTVTADVAGAGGNLTIAPGIVRFWNQGGQINITSYN